MADVCSIFCPAKINLFLAVTHRRADGFHELVSVVCPISWGDELTVEATASGRFSLTCDDAELPTDDSNLVIRAAEAFREHTGWTGGAHFDLRKRLPSGAGLGGGSSDAVGALRALDRLAGTALSRSDLSAVAASVGSDCPLFLHSGPTLMRGRGERIEPLAAAATARIAGRTLVVLTPPFGVNTGWAYGRMAAAAPGGYHDAARAEAHVAEWVADPVAALDQLGFNSFTVVVGEKFAAIPVLTRRIRDELGRWLHLSGSGSACFVWIDHEAELAAIKDLAVACWGAATRVESARCLGAG